MTLATAATAPASMVRICGLGCQMLGHSVSGSAVKFSRVGAQQKAQQLLLAASWYEERRGAAAASGQCTVVCLFGLMCRTDMMPSAAVSIQTSWQSWNPGLCYQCITGDHSCAGVRVGKRLHASSETSQRCTLGVQSGWASRVCTSVPALCRACGVA